MCGEKVFLTPGNFFDPKLFDPGRPGPPGPAPDRFQSFFNRFSFQAVLSGRSKPLKTGPQLAQSGFPRCNFCPGPGLPGTFWNIPGPVRPDLELKKRELPAGSLGRSPGFFDFRP